MASEVSIPTPATATSISGGGALLSNSKCTSVVPPEFRKPVVQLQDIGRLWLTCDVCLGQVELRKLHSHQLEEHGEVSSHQLGEPRPTETGGAPKTSPTSGRRRFQCQHCSKSFIMESQCKSHENSHVTPGKEEMPMPIPLDPELLPSSSQPGQPIEPVLVATPISGQDKNQDEDEQVTEMTSSEEPIEPVSTPPVSISGQDESEDVHVHETERFPPNKEPMEPVVIPAPVSITEQDGNEDEEEHATEAPSPCKEPIQPVNTGQVPAPVLIPPQESARFRLRSTRQTKNPTLPTNQNLPNNHNSMETGHGRKSSRMLRKRPESLPSSSQDEDEQEDATVTKTSAPSKESKKGPTETPKKKKRLMPAPVLIPSQKCIQVQMRPLKRTRNQNLPNNQNSVKVEQKQTALGDESPRILRKRPESLRNSRQDEDEQKHAIVTKASTSSKASNGAHESWKTKKSQMPVPVIILQQIRRPQRPFRQTKNQILPTHQNLPKNQNSVKFEQPEHRQPLILRKRPVMSKIRAKARKNEDGAGINEKCHTCKTCRKRIPETTFAEHTLAHCHHEKRHFSCSLCKYTTSSKFGLTDHLGMKHYKLKLYECQICKSRFGCYTGLWRHQKVCKSIASFKCSRCKRGFHNQTQLRTHVMIQCSLAIATPDDDRIIRCKICTKRFPTPALAEHIDIHVKEKYKKGNEKFSCPVRGCSYKNRQPQWVRDHVASAHYGIQSSHVCKLCGGTFAWKKNLYRHAEVCPVNRHQLRAEKSKSALKSSRKRKVSKIPAAKNESSDEGQQQEDIGENENRTCLICNESLPITSFLDHIESHILTGQTSYKCSLCSFSTPQRRFLVDHINTHYNLKPHVCRSCDQSFAAVDDLFKHRKTAHNAPETRMFKCELCDMRFVYLAKAGEHERKCTVRLQRKTDGDDEDYNPEEDESSSECED